MEEQSVIEKRLEELLEQNVPQELFLMEDGQAMEFSINKNSSQSMRMIKLCKCLIEKGGGNLTCNANGPHVIRLLVEGEVSFDTTTDFFKLNFVLISAEKRRLQDLNDYRANKSRFTDEVDVNDILYGIKSWSDCKINKEEVPEDELFKDCEEPKVPAYQSKFYSKDEDVAILEYILNNHLYTKIKGNTIWQSMEEKKICPQRSWNSLKERYIKRIVPNLSSYKVSIKDQECIKSGISGNYIPPYSVDDDTTTDEEFGSPREDTKSSPEKAQQQCVPCTRTARELSLASNGAQKASQHASDLAMETLTTDIFTKENESKSGLSSHSDNESNASGPSTVFLSPAKSYLESGEEDQKENTPPDQDVSVNDEEEESPPTVINSPRAGGRKNFLTTKSPQKVKRFRCPFSTKEDEAIIEFLHKNSARQRVKGNEIWKTLEKRKYIEGRTWQALKERFIKRILPNLHRFWSKKSLKPSLEYLEQIETKKPSSSKKSKRDRRYKETEDVKILEFIVENNHYSDVKGRSMWVDMEKKFEGRRSWSSLRERFLKVISKNLSNYQVITKEQRRRLKLITIKPLGRPNGRAQEVSASDSGSSEQEDISQIIEDSSSEEAEEELPTVEDAAETRSELESEANEPSSESCNIPVISRKYRRVKRKKRINL